MKMSFVLSSLLVIAATVGAEEEFTSGDALNAKRAYDVRVDNAYVQRRVTLRQLKKEYKDALWVAVIGKNANEAERILAAIQALEKPTPDTGKTASDEVKKLRAEVKKLKAKTESLKRQVKIDYDAAKADIIGNWVTGSSITFAIATNGTATSSIKNIKGTWELDRARRRIVIRWENKQWNSFHLPFDGKTATGDSWAAPGTSVYRKIL